MPTIITIGAMGARGFGVTAGKKEPPGSITYANGYSGAAYKPVGYSTVTITCYGSAGGAAGGGSSFGYPNAGYGSIATNTAVPNSNVMIYCPSGTRVSQWSGGGNGGLRGASQFSGGFDGGAACVATWTGGILVAAGGGGKGGGNPQLRRLGGYEGSGSALGDNYNQATNSNGANGAVNGAYYGGGGGGGGYSLGGSGGRNNSGGRAGGNGATPSSTGTGSYGYTSVSTNSSTTGYAVLSWG